MSENTSEEVFNTLDPDYDPIEHTKFMREALLQVILEHDPEEMYEYLEDNLKSASAVEGIRNATQISEGSAILYHAYVVLKNAIEDMQQWIAYHLIEEDNEEDDHFVRHSESKPVAKKKSKPISHDDEEM